MTLDGKTAPSPSITKFSRPASTILIGLGNPILGDDGVGWRIVQAVADQLALDSKPSLSVRSEKSKFIGSHPAIEVDFLSLGGLALMERVLGYERVILIDSMETGEYPTGSVHIFALADLPNPSAGHSASAHDASLMIALQAAQTIGASIPDRIDVVAVEARNVYEFTEALSPEVSAAVPIAVQAVLELLNK